MSKYADKLMGVDSFLSAPGDRTRGGAFLKGWKKEGKATIWLHQKTWSAKTWNHPVPKVITITDKETKEKSNVLRNERWNCHEEEAVLVKRYDRDDNGAREVPPVLCPACLFAEVIRELVAKGLLSWTTPIMQWDSDAEVDDEDESFGEGGQIVIHAGGVYNAFGAKDVESDRAKLKELKRAGIVRREAYKESLLVRLQWLFLLANASKLEDGIVKTFEGKGLGEKMKAEIKKQMRANKSNPDLGNPAINPYPFEWTYDAKKLFDDKYEVTGLPNEKPTDEIKRIISGAIPDVDDDLAPGNCWWLKNELESHWIADFKFPWERVFGPAEKAGLMVPPADSKEDAGELDDDDDEEGGESKGRTPEVRTKLEVLEVGADHDVWFEDAKPDPNVKGKRILLDAPEEDPTTGTAAATKEEIAAAKKLLVEWGAVEVVDVVDCDHCNGKMAGDDVDCAACGARYDEAGKLIARPCITNQKHEVPIQGDGPRYICADCGTIHELLPETPDCVGAARWKKIEGPKPAAAAAPEKPAEPGKRRRLGATPPEEEKKDEGKRRRGVPFDQKVAGK